MSRAASQAPPAGTLVCSVTPMGHIGLSPESADEGPPLSAEVRARIVRAFDEGRGPGLLALGARELRTELHPTLAYWRDIGRAFVSKACAAVDPTDPLALHVPEADPAEIAAWAQAVPPMLGAELITDAWLEDAWSDIGRALQGEVAGVEGGLAGFLQTQSAVWNVVGRVCFHVAENKRDPARPFAFMATYVSEVTRTAKPQHVPLGRALQEYAGTKNRRKLLALLAPVSRAAEASERVRALVDSGDIYHPLSWSANEAYRFLRDVAVCEEAGLIVRVPDWWSSRRTTARPKATVSVGARAPSAFGMDALLDFDVKVTLDGAPLSKQEIEALIAGSEGLVLVKGRWVEVDRERLSEVLDRWHEAQQHALAGGVTLAEAMRILAGATDADRDSPGSVDADREWSEVIAGEWLSKQLEALRSPALRDEVGASAGLEGTLRPYQISGVQWLWTLRTLRLGGCLADDMGLGKTIQVLGVLSASRRRTETGTDLLVVPASLIDNWRLEIERFAPNLTVLIAHASRMPSTELKQVSEDVVAGHDAVITTYGTLLKTDWMRGFSWRSVILDEAQAIKNPSAHQTKAVKALRSKWRLALTGTPVENHLGELWSIFDFLNPGLLGSAKGFQRFCKRMSGDSREGFAPLRRLLQPYVLRRLKTDKRVIADLPEKTEVTAYCHLTRRQAALYQQSVTELEKAIRALDGMERRGLVLAFLMRFKQICNHPSQWLGDGAYDVADSGKLARLGEICESIAGRQDKVLVFTQFREMTGPLADHLARVFGRRGEVLHGGTPVGKRQKLVEAFQESERVPFMVLSLKAGGTGLNLTAASHVVHFDRWWNPAVENQATDRAFRIGQKKNVLVHKFVCRGTIEERIDEMMASKQQLAREVLSFEPGSALTELSNDELIAMVSLDLSAAVGA